MDEQAAQGRAPAENDAQDCRQYQRTRGAYVTHVADAYHLVLGAQRLAALMESPVGVVGMTLDAHAQQMQCCAAVVLEAGNEGHVAFLGDHSPLH